jgi:RNA polymerase sigma-70 factor (ECF subfamily)
MSIKEITIFIQRIKAGDAESFWRLVEPHQQSLYAIAYSLLRNPADAAEIVQETMLKAFRRLDQLKEAHCLKSWLITIAINESRMRMRKRQEESFDDRDSQSSLEAFKLADWRNTPSNALEQKEILGAVRRALQSLSSTSRDVFILRDIRGLTVSEVAGILGISEAKVNLRLHRARRQMRELLFPLFREPASPWVPVKMVVSLPKTVIHRVVSRKIIIRELSMYIEGELKPHLRDRIEVDLRTCSRCKFLLDPARRLLYLVADEKIFLPPFVCSCEGRRAFRGVIGPLFGA